MNGLRQKKDVKSAEGTMLQGRLHGYGVLTWLGKVRACYTGDFIASERTGQGVLTCGDGFCYKGGFVIGRFQGKGSVKYSNGDRYEAILSAENAMAKVFCIG